MTVYTVIGFWDEDEPVVVGIVEGQHEVTGGDEVSEQGPWATSVEASDPDEASTLAIEEMAGTLDDEEDW